ncbi:O-methyltransferase-domain-containing protein [Coprinopsis sp. MPI-PUGE-AT-0042]|nr:O-methyltransferase-domain-containing protein [Coprinopsis sp. MPI-PUGE-AT-0042]
MASSRRPNAEALSSLVALIANATKTVESHFLSSQESGYIPSLDDTTEHPFDSQLSPPDVRQAVQTIEAACAQLCATVLKPRTAVYNRTIEAWYLPCINVAVEFKVPDVLLDHPSGLHIKDLALKAGVDANKLGRMLRVLATRHIFKEVSPDVFANNRLSMQLLSTNPISSHAYLTTGEVGKAAGYMTSVLKDKEWGPSRNPCKTAFNRSTGFSGNLFQYLDSEAGSQLGPRFAQSMAGVSGVQEAESVISEYPWKELHSGASVCDLGGGIGHMLMKIGKEHPHLQLKLQDIPERVEEAKEVVWPREFPRAIEENRIEFKPVNFFDELPISGCDVYYLKHILHDWQDSQCLGILKNVRKAMGPHSRVLIHDYVIQNACRSNEDKAQQQQQAPEPLLANFGAGRIRQYAVDMAVMTLVNGGERMLKDLLKLAAAADLQLVKVWDFDELCLVELCAVDT